MRYSIQTPVRILVTRMLLIVGCLCCSFAASGQTSTNIAVSNSVQRTAVSRLGVNLGDQTYWDSGQMMKNLIFQNPGFEGLKFRTILKCAHNATANSCQDDNQYSRQQTGFWKGGTYEVMSGASAGVTGNVVQSTQSANPCSGCGQTVQFDKSTNLAVGDYYAVTNYFPGTGDAGWWDNISGGGTIATEMTDLSPNTVGKQALLISAPAGKSASIAQYFESFRGLSFIQLNGKFELTFRAKGVGGTNQLSVNVQRLQGANAAFLNQKVTLTNSWQDYKLNFSANETGSAVGTVQLILGAAGSSVELDDVSLQQTDSNPANTTVFRDDVVKALKELNPGTLRMMAAGAALGSDIPNQLAPTLARYRSSFSSTKTGVNTIAYGIDEFIHLCQTINADPWITVPTSTTPEEMKDLILYLTGDGSDSFSASRIARGQSKPWTSVFTRIHIELGNETWNGDFKGESMAYPGYPQWANKVFATARQMSGFKASQFDLVLDGWSAVPGYNQGLLHYSTQHDSIDIAPYLMFAADDVPQATMFGALLAEPEMTDESANGKVYQDMQAAAAAPTPTYVNVYETNLGTMLGKITQTSLDQLTPSVGAGLAHTMHMLMMMRQGVRYQNAFALQQYQFLRGDQKIVRMWGMVVDMGTTNRRRPQFLTQALANTAIGGNMLTTTHSGANPTWDQPKADGVELKGAHYLQSFAFQNGKQSSAVIFNLNLTSALPVTFSGANAPTGAVQLSQITSANITDNNETADDVHVTTKSVNNFTSSTSLSLPPFSMTVLTWIGNNIQAKAQAPEFSVPAGSYNAAQTVSLSDTTTGTTIYFTTDGSTPTTSSSKYVGPITVSKSQTLQAIATASGIASSNVSSASYAIGSAVAATPTFSPAPGSYTTAQTVSISDATAGATIYYTTDGSTPTTNSKQYAGPISVSVSETVKALAAAANYTSSSVATAMYAINSSSITATPTFSIPSGMYATSQSVGILHGTSTGLVYYTLDGSIPTTASTQFKGPIEIAQTTTIKAISKAANYATSAVATATYTISQSNGGIDMSKGFTGSKMRRNGSAKLVGSKLQLTDGSTGQAGTAWYPTKVSVSRFTSDFDFQLPTSTADGFTFTLQNASKAYYALGGNGGALGYQGISRSVAVAFSLYQSGVSNAQSVGVYTGGVSPHGSSIDLSASGVNFHKGNSIHAHIVYNGTTLTLTLTDNKTAAVVTKSFTVDIPGSVGSGSAYVGFTAGTGSRTAIQNILDLKFTN